MALSVPRHAGATRGSFATGDRVNHPRPRTSDYASSNVTNRFALRQRGQGGIEGRLLRGHHQHQHRDALQGRVAGHAGSGGGFSDRDAHQGALHSRNPLPRNEAGVSATWTGDGSRIDVGKGIVRVTR